MNLEELDSNDLLISTVESLTGLGFTKAHLATDKYDIEWLAKEATSKALADANLKANDIDFVIWISAIPENHIVPCNGFEPPPHLEVLKNFRYRAGWLQDFFEFDKADFVALTQQGCS
jgi:hypothetical protein